MKCIKCRCKNINKANYCKNCKYHFSKEEQEAAKSITFFGKLEKLEKVYNIITLNAITGHIIFKILSIVIILGLGIYITLSNDKINVLESDNYLVKYNKNENEYYLISKEKNIPLNLYLSNNIKTINIKHKDKNNNLINEKQYDKVDEISLSINSNEDYYLINADKDTLKLYIYLEEYVEVENEK